LGRLRSIAPLRVRALDEEDWANAWKEHFHVQRIGERLVIVPSWREYAARPADVPLLLDPGMAFGTGLHPTTRLCLLAVERLVRPGHDVLDLGTGSGILAIAAARLGARSVQALDVEPVAIEVARTNAVRNQVDDRVEVALGSLPHPRVPPASRDLVLANITIRALQELQTAVRGVLRPGGRAVFSGILAEDGPRFRDALVASGWRDARTDQEADWIAITVSLA